VKKFWIILAGVLAGVAVVLFLRDDYEKAFVSAALGAIAWILSYRVQMRAHVKANEPSEEIDDDLESNEEEEQL
jgi:hypothetical protein